MESIKRKEPKNNNEHFNSFSSNKMNNKVFITVVRSQRGARVFRASLNLPDSCI